MIYQEYDRKTKLQPDPNIVRNILGIALTVKMNRCLNFQEAVSLTEWTIACQSDAPTFAIHFSKTGAPLAEPYIIFNPIDKEETMAHGLVDADRLMEEDKLMLVNRIQTLTDNLERHRQELVRAQAVIDRANKEYDDIVRIAQELARENKNLEWKLKKLTIDMECVQEEVNLRTKMLSQVAADIRKANETADVDTLALWALTILECNDFLRAIAFPDEVEVEDV